MNTHPFATEPSLDDLAGRYRDILLDYLASPGEQDRSAVFDLGYEAAARRFNLQEVIELHHDVLVNLFEGPTLAKETVRLAGELLEEVTAIYSLLCLRVGEEAENRA